MKFCFGFYEILFFLSESDSDDYPGTPTNYQHLWQCIVKFVVQKSLLIKINTQPEIDVHSLMWTVHSGLPIRDHMMKIILHCTRIHKNRD